MLGILVMVLVVIFISLVLSNVLFRVLLFVGGLVSLTSVYKLSCRTQWCSFDASDVRVYLWGVTPHPPLFCYWYMCGQCDLQRTLT